MTSMKLLPGYLAFPFLILGCKVANRTGQGSEALSVAATKSAVQICPKQETIATSSGQSVVSCEELYPKRPYVRPAPDDLENKAKASFAAGVVISYFGSVRSTFFVDRHGTKYAAVDAQGKNVNFATPGALPAGMQAPSNAYLNLIYRVTGKIGKTVKDPIYGNLETIRVADAEPIISITGCAMDSALLGTWEGTVSRRMLQPTGHYPFTKNFDEAREEPLQMTFTKAEYLWNLMEWSGEGRTDFEAYKLTGTIDNLATAAKTPEDKTLPALDKLGAENPFLGAKDNSVELYRQTNMHGIGFDNHWVLTYPSGSKDLTINGMSDSIDLFTPATLISLDVPERLFAQLTVRPHIPFRGNGHVVSLTPTDIGRHRGECEK